jgi:hypothetical protein
MTQAVSRLVFSWLLSQASCEQYGTPRPPTSVEEKRFNDGQIAHAVAQESTGQAMPASAPGQPDVPIRCSGAR